MNRLTVIVSGFAALLIFCGFTFAQGGRAWKGSGGWGPGSDYNRMYDQQTVETIQGEVINVDKKEPRKGMASGIHLLLKTDKESISVHLGPSWFIENQEVQIEPKDQIEVTGSRIKFEEKPAIIAAEVKKGDQLLTLRDKNGFPAWSGWRKRR